MRNMTLLAIIFVVVAAVNGHLDFQLKVPNGAIVPNPCNPSMIWPGVGHQNSQGGGVFNPFGVDCNRNNYQWDSKLCHMDSDGDGLTNGQELGDPGCIWTQGSTPSMSTNLTHPGICEPLNSPKCISQNSWLANCSGTVLNCPAIDNPGVKNYTMRWPVSSVPNTETTVTCHKFLLPNDSDYEIIAIEPILDNIGIVHSIQLNACVGDPNDHPTNEVYQCEVPENCPNMIGQWVLGASGQCLNDQHGFRIGPTGYQYAIVQIHWDNPLLKENLTDSSGMRFYYTSQLRPNRGGSFMTGPDFLDIPPGLQEVIAVGWCVSACTRQLPGPIFLASVYLHVHRLGMHGEIALYRNGTLVKILLSVADYDYNMKVYDEFENPIELMPGDAIRTTCVYDSTHRNTTTHFGRSTSDEMCSGTFTYYPLVDGFQFCSQNNTLDVCSGATKASSQPPFSSAKN